jgi:hypothetical protein
MVIIIIIIILSLLICTCIRVCVCIVLLWKRVIIVYIICELPRCGTSTRLCKPNTSITRTYWERSNYCNILYDYYACYSYYCYCRVFTYTRGSYFIIIFVGQPVVIIRAAISLPHRNTRDAVLDIPCCDPSVTRAYNVYKPITV